MRLELQTGSTELWSKLVDGHFDVCMGRLAVEGSMCAFCWHSAEALLTGSRIMMSVYLVPSLWKGFNGDAVQLEGLLQRQGRERQGRARLDPVMLYIIFWSLGSLSPCSGEKLKSS